MHLLPASQVRLMFGLRLFDLGDGSSGVATDIVCVLKLVSSGVTSRATGDQTTTAAQVRLRVEVRDRALSDGCPG